MNEEIEKALEVLRQGGTILYPTDTIWGIGCDATNRDAVQKIYKIKERDDRKSMLVLIDNVSRLTYYISEVPEIAYELIDVSDKPLTIIYPEARHLPENLLAEDGSLGIRITSDPFCKKLIGRCGKPIVSTSANLSGQPAPSNFSLIPEEIVKGVDHVVNWRREETAAAVPSSIIKLDNRGHIQILRP